MQVEHLPLTLIALKRLFFLFFGGVQLEIKMYHVHTLHVTMKHLFHKVQNHMLSSIQFKKCTTLIMSFSLPVPISSFLSMMPTSTTKQKNSYISISLSHTFADTFCLNIYTHTHTHTHTHIYLHIIALTKRIYIRKEDSNSGFKAG